MSTFFDLLPDDMHEHIAKLLLPPPMLLLPQSNERLFIQPRPLLEEGNHAILLNYAKVGDKQRKAVMKALRNRLFPFNFSLRTMKDWILTCWESIHEINLENLSGISFEAGFLNLPNLCKCTIRGIPDQLSAISGSPMLSDVTITVIRASLWRDIVRALGSVPLTVLSFQVRIYGRMKKLDRIPTDQLVLLCKACPKIRHLELVGHVAMTTNLYTMISNFRKLKKLGLNCIINAQDIRCMQRLDEVDLYKSNSIQVAAGLGKSLVGVTQEDFPASAMDIEKLSECPNLRRLIINLNANAEAALVGKINNVEDLCLAWARNWSGEQNVDGAFFEPNGEVLQDVIRSAPNLKSLVIARAVLREEALKKILEICGRQLMNIEVHVDKHGVPIPVRVETILRTVSQYCFGLRTLWLLEETDSTRRSRYFATRAQKEECVKALKALMKAAPEFVSYRNLQVFLDRRLGEQ